MQKEFYPTLNMYGECGIVMFNDEVLHLKLKRVSKILKIWNVLFLLCVVLFASIFLAGFYSLVQANNPVDYYALPFFSTSWKVGHIWLIVIILLFLVSYITSHYQFSAGKIMSMMVDRSVDEHTHNRKQLGRLFLGTSIVMLHLPLVFYANVSIDLMLFTSFVAVGIFFVSVSLFSSKS